MIAEIGLFCLILGLLVAIIQGVLPLAGYVRNIYPWVRVAKPSAVIQFLLVACSYLCLTISFVNNDFSVEYVALNSNSDLPLMYRIAGVWGSHEGSLLLWSLILAIWSLAVVFFSKSIPERVIAKVLAVMGLISVGFLAFMLFTSNPFERIYPAPLEGQDLNPLLQDPALVIHPPMLYMGYVGFSVAFAFAIAALIGGRLDSAWAKWSRPWTLVAWGFLTSGIALGSWWAYYELGWGGWWFWDPVENASFMPWLVGTALFHSLAATEKRGVFKAWTVLLAIFAFALSLLGTFLVRSGVLTSVHAFATDPSRGLFILIFIVIVVGGSLALYAWRAPTIRSSGGFNLVSREAGLLLNNVLLVASAATILLGTLYPLLIDALGMGKISVGPPYFNAVFIPITAPLAILVGFGMIVRWKRDSIKRITTSLGPLLLASIALGLLWPLTMDEYKLSASIGAILACWIVLTAFAQLVMRFKNSKSASSFFKTPLSIWGMSLGHIGLGIFVIGISFSSAYSLEKDLRMSPGEKYKLGEYTFYFNGVKKVTGPNYTSDTGLFKVSKQGTKDFSLYPEKRVYNIKRSPMTEAGIKAGLMQDLYTVLGEPLPDGHSWTIRLYYKPYVRWIWLGPLLMMIGGFLSASDKRYRMMKARDKALSKYLGQKHVVT